jgi:glycosyltransferase involved in cell wall biosynthesis
MLVYQTDWAEVGSLRRASPVLASVHDVRPHHGQLPHAVETALLRSLYRRAGHLLVHHSVLADELCADFGVERARVHVLPHPMDATDMRLPASSSGRPEVLLFGALRSNKGVDVLLDAAAILERDLEATIVIAGHGDASTEASTLARAPTLPNVRLELGFVSQQRKRELFSNASCVVLPYTEFHSQSGVLADAYSYRVPLVVSDVGAIGATVREDGTGLVVPPRDAEALAAGLADLVTRPADGLSGRIEAAVRRNDFALIGPKLRAVYDVVVAGS